MPKKQGMRLRLKTGDLLLFSGKQFSSESIAWVTGSRWSHVAMVLAPPDCQGLCLWEATTDTNVQDLDRVRTRPGVMRVPLAERVQGYDGRISVRQLSGVRFNADDRRALSALRKKLASRRYETSTWQLMSAAYDGPLGNQRENLSSLFCSELVAEAYQALGLIARGPRDKPSNEYVPADFSQRREDLPWRRGRLGPEIPLNRRSVKMRFSSQGVSA